MARVHFTEQAQSELDAIIEYYERIGADNFAEVFEEKGIEKIRPLEQFPQMGRIVPEIRRRSARFFIATIESSTWWIGTMKRSKF